MLRITRMGPTDRREQWGNRNVDRESVNRRLLIAKLLDICLLLFQIRFQTIPLMLTRPNSVHSAIHERVLQSSRSKFQFSPQPDCQILSSFATLTFLLLSQCVRQIGWEISISLQRILNDLLLLLPSRN